MSLAGPSNVKLRLSCDECLATKVKCDKQKPGCGRCQGLNKSCVYGISRKIGRPPSAMRSKQREGVAWNAMNAACIAPKTSHNSEPSDFSANWSSADNDTEWNDSGTFEALDPFEFFPSWSGSEDQNHGYRPTEVGSPSTANLAAAHVDNEHMIDPLFQLEEQRSCQFDDMPASLKPLIGCCATGAYTILGSLTCASEPTIIQDMVRKTPEKMLLETSDDDVLRLDKVLQRCKTAVESMTGLLDCSCAQAPHLAMLYISIVSKIISWYDVATHLTRVNLPTEFSQPRSASCLSSLGSTGLQLNSTWIRVGCFQVDKEADQAELHKQLLLIEIGKVEVLIDRMLSTYRQQQSFTAEGKSSSASSWHDLCCEAIRTEVREMKESITRASGSLPNMHE